MKSRPRWCLRATIFDSEATFGALRTISWYMACRDFLLQVILFPPAALLLANVSRLFWGIGAPKSRFLAIDQFVCDILPPYRG